MSDIFISHAAQDREYAHLLATALEHRGWSVCWNQADTDSQTKTPAAADCSCVIVIWSEASVTSPWVCENAETGKNNNTLLAVAFDQTEPPEGFHKIPVIRLQSWRGGSGHVAFQQLVKNIGFHLNPPATKEADQDATQLVDPILPMPSRERALLQKANYEIKRKIGEGGMATVYLAVHKLLDREVAVKIISPKIATTKMFQQGFVREARIVAKLEHPHIVRIYDGGADHGLFYMAMEYLPGGTLRQRLNKAAISQTEALKIVWQIASALQYAHAKGYIHRDLKPANILFRANGDVALADFGIAKLQGTVSEMTQMGMVTGTPHYMSPEQAMGQDIDQRADIYSLGVVLYEMLTGKRMYEGETPLAVSYQHVHADIPRLQGDATKLQPLLDQMLAKKPGDRLASADKLLELLTSLQKTAPKAHTENPQEQADNLPPTTFRQNRQTSPSQTTASSSGKKTLMLSMLAVAIGGTTWLTYYLYTSSALTHQAGSDVGTLRDDAPVKKEQQQAKDQQLAKQKQQELDTLKQQQEKELAELTQQQEKSQQLAEQKQQEIDTLKEQQIQELDALKQQQAKDRTLAAQRRQELNSLKQQQTQELETLKQQQEKDRQLAEQKQQELDALKEQQEKERELAEKRQQELESLRAQLQEQQEKEQKLEQKNQHDQDKKIAEFQEQQKQAQIKRHLESAAILEDKRRFFDHSDWSEGCRQALVDTDGPYPAKDSAEWRYRQVLQLDEANAEAKQQLEKLENRKQLEFSDCNNYERPAEEDPLKGLFK